MTSIETIYLPNLVEECSSLVGDKRKIISKSKDSNFRNLIFSSTIWLPEDTSFSHRVFVLSRYTQETFPKCVCGNFVKLRKDVVSLGKFCSDKCKQSSGFRLSEKANESLRSYEWMYQKRIIEKLSYDSIAEILKVSSPVVKNWCNVHNLPELRYNESRPEVTALLRNLEFLKEEHQNKRKKLSDLAKEIGTSTSTLSRIMDEYGIETNSPNSYDRRRASASKECLLLVDFLKSVGYAPLINNRSILKNNYELDIVIEEEKLAIEYNGLYSHIYRPDADSVAKKKDSNYHLNKLKWANEKGYKLIHVFSDDWLSSPDKIKSLILSKLNRYDTTIYGRKCSVEVCSKPEKSSFLNQNHLQGNDSSQIDYCLKYDDVIVAVMTFCKSRFNKKYDWELSRFACKQYTNVVGGFSKLLSAFRKEYSGSIVSYADRSWSEGNVYIKNGFKKVRTNPPGYSYVDSSYSKRLHRYQFRKTVIGKDDPRPEWEIMEEKGFHRIWNCGTFTFVLP